MVTRRELIKTGLTAAVIAGLPLSAGRYLSKALAQKEELRIYNYSYYIDPRINEWFSEQFGFQVVYDEYEAAEEAWAKLQVGGGGYDIIILTDSYLKDAISQGLVRKMEKNRLPNLANLDPGFISIPQDPGLEHSVPYMWGTTGLGVNRNLVAENIDSWGKVLEDERFLEKYKGRISMLEEFVEVVAVTMLYLGLDPSKGESWSMENVEDISRILIKQKPYLAGYYGASKYIPELAGNRLAVAQAWSGDILTAQEENPKVEYVIPEREGGLKWGDYIVIPRDARNLEAAYLWINFVLDPLNAAVNMAYTYYPVPLRNELIEKGLQEAYEEGLIDVEPVELLGNPAILPPPSIASKLRNTYPLDQEGLRVLEEIRKRVIVGGGDEGVGGISREVAIVGGGLLASILGGAVYISYKKSKSKNA